MKILLPFDGSDSATRAAQFACVLCKNDSAAELHVLNVATPPIVFGDYVGITTLQDLEKSAREQGARVAAEAGAILDKCGLAHRIHVEVGSIEEIIAAQAEALQCDLIVMGCRGLGALSSLLLGSVATKVIHLAKVPVTLVK
jgi:nucleotide-binding universal stress UspA family protein